MNTFHPLEVRDIRRETRDAVSILFNVPGALRDTFQFRQGQYLVLRTQLDGEEIRRSYSICSAPHENELRVAIKKVSGGRFSEFANQTLVVGDYLDVMAPSGNFFVELNAQHHGRYLGVAAGSGITPLLSIIKTTLEQEPHSQFTLLYGNRSSSGTLFREQLGDLKDRYLERLKLIFVMSRERQDVDLYNGRLDGQKCRQFFSRWIDVSALDHAFICGPHAMTVEVRQALIEHQLDPARVHCELFASPSAGRKQADRQTTSTDTSRTSLITVISDGNSLAFELPRNTLSILDAGNQNGAELPYACKAGVCSTCKARLVEGEVEMDSNFALEDYEIEAGFVLSCQCFPLSDRVVLDFDQL